MAGNKPVTNAVEVKLVWSFGGQPAALNILHFSNPSGAAITQTNANTIGATIMSQYSGGSLPAQIAGTVTVGPVHVRSMAALSDPWFISTAASSTGASASPPLPAATALVVTLKTGLRGRSYNGRVYLWGYATNANDVNGGITAAADAASAAFINGIRTSLAGGTPALALAVLSRYWTPPGGTATVERDTPVLTNVTNAVLLDRRWDVQRRRAVPGI